MQPTYSQAALSALYYGHIINRQIALSGLGRGLIDLDPDLSKSIELD